MAWNGNDDDDDGTHLAGQVPTSFGRQSVHFDAAAQIERARRPSSALPPPKQKPPPDSDDDSDDESGDDDDEFPVSHELALQPHSRAVSSVSVDKSGTRLASASADGTFSLHDFPAMTPTTIRAFKTVDPSTVTRRGAPAAASAVADSASIQHILFSPHSADHLLVITSGRQARLFDRDGDLITDYVAGDMYLRDQRQTKGHTAALAAATWHPTRPDRFATAAADSTIRIWDPAVRTRQTDIAVLRSSAAGSAGRTRVTALAWAPSAGGGASGSVIVAATLDGSLALFDGNGPFNRPSALVQAAHPADSVTSSLATSPDGRLILSRDGDNTIRLWDSRKLTAPVNKASLPSSSTEFPSASAVFSPDGAAVATGTPDGNLHILNPATLRPELVTRITADSAVVAVAWPGSLGQMVVGAADGSLRMLFRPGKSKAGALSVLSRPPKQRHIDDLLDSVSDPVYGLSADAVILPGSAASGPGGFNLRKPTIRMSSSGKARDPRRPHVPALTPFAKSEPDQQHVRDKVPLAAMREEDPREALLKYADAAAKNPIFTAAWKETQPTTMYAQLSDDEDDSKDGHKKSKKKDGDGPPTKKARNE